MNQQFLMERVIEFLPDSERKRFQFENGRYQPVNEWQGVKLDAKGNIISVKFGLLFKQGGALFLEYLPPTVVEFTAPGCQLTSVGDLSQVPSSLQTINLSNNLLTGEVLDKKLPEGIVSLDLSHNMMDRRLPFENLPSTLNDLNLSHNKMRGGIDFQRLPEMLINLDISHNVFWGEVSIENLPKRISKLVATENLFWAIHGDRQEIEKRMAVLDIEICDPTAEWMGWGDIHTSTKVVLVMLGIGIHVALSICEVFISRFVYVCLGSSEP